MSGNRTNLPSSRCKNDHSTFIFLDNRTIRESQRKSDLYCKGKLCELVSFLHLMNGRSIVVLVCIQPAHSHLPRDCCSGSKETTV